MKKYIQNKKLNQQQTFHTTKKQSMVTKHVNIKKSIFCNPNPEKTEYCKEVQSLQFSQSSSQSPQSQPSQIPSTTTIVQTNSSENSNDIYSEKEKKLWEIM